MAIGSSIVTARRRLVLVLALSTGLVAGGCSRTPTRLAFIGGLTGRLADIGVGGRDGVQLALERAAARDGRSIELVAYDDGQDPGAAQRLVQRIKADGHAIAVGPMTSAMAQAMVPHANAAGLTLVSPTVTAAELEGIDDQFLRVVSSLSEYAARSAEFHARHRVWKRYAVVRDDGNRAYTRNWAQHFSAALARHGGGTANEHAFVYGPGFSYEDLAARVLADEPEAVVIVASATDTARLAQALRHRTATLPLLASEWAATEQLLSLGGRAVEGLHVTQFLDRESRAPAYLAFVDAFQQRFGRGPGFAEAAAFDAANVVLAALAARRSGEAAKQALLRLRRFDGLQQTLEFSDAGDARRDVVVTQVRQGRFVVVR